MWIVEDEKAWGKLQQEDKKVVRLCCYVVQSIPRVDGASHVAYSRTAPRFASYWFPSQADQPLLGSADSLEMGEQKQ